VAYPPNPCFAELGFQDINGNPVGTTLNVALQAGQTASLAVNGNTLTNVFGQRVEVQPTVIITPNAPPSQCDASAEVFDNLLEISSVLVPGTLGFAPSPEFGMVGLTLLQTGRLNVVAYPPVPCIGQLSFVNGNGVPVGSKLNVQLNPGQAASLDLPGSTLVTKLGQRAEVQPIITASSGACVAAMEVYVNGLGTTSVYYPPVPCSSVSNSCSSH
jgi:hypothetical protein